MDLPLTGNYRVCMHDWTPLTARRYPVFFQLTPTVFVLWLAWAWVIDNNNRLHHDPGKEGVKTVVIDPGHGGRDPGCLGSQVNEKEITLALAILLRDKIKSRFPGVKVVLTRESDIFLPLFERSQIANKAEADLFISLHCNALSNAPSIHGSETYVLGLHRAADNLAVAQRENESILLEDNFKLNYGDFDPNSAEAYILMAMYQNAYLEKSIVFAGMVEEEFRQHAGRTSKGVKQAGFLVLRENAMPSVLVETGFLTHREEEKFLHSPAGQELIAESLVRAFGRYKSRIEKGDKEIEKSEKQRSASPEPPGKGLAHPETTTAGFPVGEWHAVQISALSKPLPADHPWRKQIPSFLEKKEEALIKILSGPFKTVQEAEKAKAALAQSGFKGIFTVVYQGDLRQTRP